MRHVLIITATFIASSIAASLNIENTPTVSDMDTVAKRRIANILDYGTASDNSVDTWMQQLESNGTWPDVNYVSGCGARIANWPATKHLLRTLNLACAYYNSSPLNKDILNKAQQALDYWFNNDFTMSGCLTTGGTSISNCPCGTPGLWNRNWYDQIIYVPKLVGYVCLLLTDQLTDTEKSKCIEMQARSFNRLLQQGNQMKRDVGVLTGANLMDVSSIGITLGLFESNVTALQQALDLFYGGVTVSQIVAGDGIQADGSFMQHNGLLYNGNYGQDFVNDLLSVFIETKETNLIPNNDSQIAFDILMSGTEWMIIADTKLHKMLWQYSIIGRMVSFRYSDGQASGGVSMNMTQIAEGSEGWEDEDALKDITDRLSEPSNHTVNQGELIGTRYFYNADYMIHRTPNYIITMKMYSTRTINSECLNVQNPFGFHLSDGSIYNYITGDEYVDTFGVWDWNLVPGTTVDYGGTPLTCKTTKNYGLKDFVGGVANGNTGIAVMDFLNPLNKNLAFSKTVFFFPSGYAIQVGPVDSKNHSAPLITVLDQSKLNGDIYVDGNQRNTNGTFLTRNSTSIWHNSVGYYFPDTAHIYVDAKVKKANWSTIGISPGNETMRLFSSYIKHGHNYSTSGLLTQYIVQPNITQSDFTTNIQQEKIPIQLDFQASSPTVNAAYSAEDKTIAIAFWTAGSYNAPWLNAAVSVTDPCVLLLCDTGNDIWQILVADPSQKLLNVTLDITINTVKVSKLVPLPDGNKAGSGVNITMSFQK